MKPLTWSLFLFIIFMTHSQAAESAYARTQPDVIEVKTLPAGRLIEHTATTGTYFDSSNNLFRPLFRYIQKHQISMTTPVEARIDPGKMRFWISREQEAKADADDGNVRVIDIPERTVAAIGGKGGYSKDNFDQARDRLIAWLAERDDLEPVGEPFAAYWNGPFTPWFMKKFEVMVEVRSVGSGTAN
jgi:effector-binding domain-containing protein